MILVEKLASNDPLLFSVRVREAETETRHQTSVAEAEAARLAPQAPAEALIEAAFRFLLDREPKESILARFDLAVIARYFPEFERELPSYLAKTSKRA